MTKKVLLVIASDGFQPSEYWETRKEIERAGLSVATASNRIGLAKAAYEGEDAVVDLLLEDVDTQDYSGIFLVGGPGSLVHLNNEKTYRLVRECQKNNIPFGAICLSPRILAAAGVLTGKKATGWNDDGKLENIFSQHDVLYSPQPVVVDANVITADGPHASVNFGKTIAKMLK